MQTEQELKRRLNFNSDQNEFKSDQNEFKSEPSPFNQQERESSLTSSNFSLGIDFSQLRKEAEIKISHQATEYQKALNANNSKFREHCSKGHLYLVNQMVHASKKFDADSQDASGHSALMLVCQKATKNDNNKDVYLAETVAEIIRKYHPNINLIMSPKDQTTALHLACKGSPSGMSAQQQQNEIINTLLDQEHIDVTIQDKQGNLALHYACQLDMPNVIEKFQQKKADFTCPNNGNVTPLMLLTKRVKELDKKISKTKKNPDLKNLIDLKNDLEEIEHTIKQDIKERNPDIKFSELESSNDSKEPRKKQNSKYNMLDSSETEEEKIREDSSTPTKGHDFTNKPSTKEVKVSCFRRICCCAKAQVTL